MKQIVSLPSEILAIPGVSIVIFVVLGFLLCFAGIAGMLNSTLDAGTGVVLLIGGLICFFVGLLFSQSFRKKLAGFLGLQRGSINEHR
jgi:hypothetical protein